MASSSFRNRSGIPRIVVALPGFFARIDGLMASQVLDKRWPWLTAAGLVLLIAAASLLEVRIGGVDKRPVGTAVDIEGLRDRSDVNVLFILIDTLRADRL